jgi:hypothetical protein
LGETIPPFPILPIELFSPISEKSLTCQTPAILDTGSDCTLVPLDLLMKVKARAIDRAIRVPVCGVSTLAIPYAVGLKFDRYTISACIVLGCPGEVIDNMMLLGRDIMRRYRIEFDGERSAFTIF